MGLIQMGIPHDITLFLKAQTGSEVFIETGTYYGGTATWASGQFKTVHTVEFSKPIYDEVSKNLAHISNISFHYGDTRIKLKQILDGESKNQKPIVWLDAHWSSGITFGEEDQCPLLQELEILLALQLDVCILIDDARLFLAPPPKPHNRHQYPDIAEIISLFDKNWYTVVYDDVIIIVPVKLKESFQQFMQAKTTADNQARNTPQIRPNLLERFLRKIKAIR